MNILLDAQLPRSLVRLLQSEGCNALHTLDLPEGNRSSDAFISATADRENRIVFSKDADFIQSQLLQDSPSKLLLIATGIIRISELAALLMRWLPTLRNLFTKHQLIELHRTTLIIRR